MNFETWAKDVPDVIRKDSLWSVEAYRLSLFLSDISWKDVVKLSKASGMRSVSDQLYRACGSICANIEEGYSKRSSKDRARFYEYALGSAREARGWFYRGRHIFSEEVVTHRMGLATQIIRLLLIMVPDQREKAANQLCEAPVEYVVSNPVDAEVPL